MATIIGKNSPKIGVTPAIALVNPKYDHNVGAIQRAASCFGAKQVWYSGNRVNQCFEQKKRLPREERMKGYKDVDVINYDYFFDQFPKGVTPVAIELTQGSEPLTQFEHPENPLYVFGPEDGSIDKVLLRHCHRFVFIPTKHCTNLAAAVYLVLYDRLLKRQQAGVEPVLPMNEVLNEKRGYELD